MREHHRSIGAGGLITFRHPIRGAFVATLLAGWFAIAWLAGEESPAPLTRSIAAAQAPAGSHADFPAELIDFVPYPGNPVFAAEGPGHWDVKIRERGWILRDGDVWRMWFTGYDGTRPGKKMLGLATSSDGLTWVRDPRNPIYSEHWCEDMMVLKREETYYMFAEGAGDQAELLTSLDGVAWTRRGKLDVRKTNGQPISPGPFGTPTAWHESGVWYLFYERMDQGVWLATSPDLKVWRNVQDGPVLARGPAEYDKHAVALNQIVRHGDSYYAYYHGSDTHEWREWSVNLARSKDLVHWEKYSHNPIVAGNQSSGIVVEDGGKYRLYTMHDQVRAYLPKK